MLRRSFWGNLAIGLLTGLMVGLSPAWLGAERKEDLSKDFFEPLAQMVDLIEARYVDEVDLATLRVGAIRGILSKLDRHSVYWPPKLYDDFKTDAQGEFGGLGVQIKFDPVKKAVIVEQPIAGTPAARKGLMRGDMIVEVYEESTGQLSRTSEFEDVYDAIKVLRGEPGATVTITVIPADTGERKKISIKREVIRIPEIRAVEMVEGLEGVGYLYVSYFNEPMVESLKKAIEDLQGQGAKGVVLDLRFNPGGLLKPAEDFADMFLDGGVVVSTNGRRSVEMTFARKGESFPDLELVLLVNGASASASEIVSAALQHHKRATIVGASTYGKASVQTVLPTPFDEGAVKFTTARYFTPGGVLIEGKGVQPDVVVKLSEEDVRKLWRHMGRKVEYPPPLPDDDETEGGTGQDDAEEVQKPFEDVQLKRAAQIVAQRIARQRA